MGKIDEKYTYTNKIAFWKCQLLWKRMPIIISRSSLKGLGKSKTEGINPFWETEMWVKLLGAEGVSQRMSEERLF